MAQDALDVSVVICTYTEERWDDLVAAIESVRQQTPPLLEIIIVVDHNPDLLGRVRACLTDVIAVENQGAQGLSEARNSGIAIAKGRQIAFLDDDAIAEPDCFIRLSRWCDEPHVLGAGGNAQPMWVGDSPAWFPEEFYWVVGCTYRGMPETAGSVRNLFGCCMCIRREVFETLDGFRKEMGRVNAVPLGCEETELCIRARQHWPQGTFIYEPQAVIHHRVPTSRANWAYFRSRCYAEGLSKALLSRLVGTSDALASEQSYTFRTLPQGIMRGVGDAILRRDLTGLARAGAIIAGLAITTTGYLLGKTVLHKKLLDVDR